MRNTNRNIKFGFVPTNQSILYAFDENDASRLNQDVGLDGLNNDEERAKYAGHNLIQDFGKLNSNDIAWAWIVQLC